MIYVPLRDAVRGSVQTTRGTGTTLLVETMSRLLCVLAPMSSRMIKPVHLVVAEGMPLFSALQRRHEKTLFTTASCCSAQELFPLSPLFYRQLINDCFRSAWRWRASLPIGRCIESVGNGWINLFESSED